MKPNTLSLIFMLAIAGLALSGRPILAALLGLPAALTVARLKKCLKEEP